jgi:hypothetical protein
MGKKVLAFIMMLFLATQVPLLAQVADTLVVPDEDGAPDALARCILGDTTATGERNNINRVYQLQRGKIYFLTGQVYCEKFPLTLIGGGDETLALPVIAPFPLTDGSIPRISIAVWMDSYFKDIYFQGCAPNDQRYNGDRPLYIASGVENVRLTVESCVVEGFKTAGIFNSGLNSSIFIKDCHYRNNNWSGVFSGQFFYNGAAATLDTISIVNCTFFLGSSYFMCTNRAFARYTRFEHNTLFINHTNPFYAPYLSNAEIKNNIFFAPAACGETAFEREQGYYDWDGERLSAGISIDTIATDIAEANGITDENRRVIFTNNAYYWPQSVKDMLASKTDVEPPVWMNDRTLAFFNNDAQYPNLIENNNVEADPGFGSDLQPALDSLLMFIDLFRTTGSGRSYFYNPDGGIIFPCRWPVPEDLSYTNADLLVAAEGGFPLGDLNWFPEKKIEWEYWLAHPDAVEDNDVLPSSFSLQQNYPNPFNPATKIKFQIPETGLVSLKIFDVLGREVSTLVHKELSAGNYTIDFNAASLSSGVYFYRLDAGNFTSVKKMVLTK